MYNSEKFRGGRKILFFVPVIIAAIFGITWLVMTLWNSILPGVIHVSPLTYWQAMGLLVLCKILFGGFRFGGRHRYGNYAWKEKYKNMTEEEREAFKTKWKERCMSYRGKSE